MSGTFLALLASNAQIVILCNPVRLDIPYRWSYTVTSWDGVPDEVPEVRIQEPERSEVLQGVWPVTHCRNKTKVLPI